MALSEEQLNTWSSIGAQVTSKETYATIKGALEDGDAPYANRSIETFLQGSYGNDTNVYAESDVDVIIKTYKTYHYDISALSHADNQQFDRHFSSATYSYSTYHAEVTSWLAGRFGADATIGNKSVEIAARNKRRKADVLIANEFRLYRPSNAFTPLHYISGVRFVTRSGQVIVNYPKEHSANLTAKHQATGGWLKPTVRIFKNMRNALVADNKLAKGAAPSYFIEGMLYNVPTNHFGVDYRTTVSNCINWLWKKPLDQLTCANEIHPLIGSGSATSWPPENISAFLQATIDRWNA